MPATLTYPGVYIEELPSNVHTIAGVATSIAAFIGWAPQGPTDEAVLVESFPEFISIFGSFVPNMYLAYAVNHFFANGGSQAYIIRLVWDGTLAPAPGTNPAVAATAVAAGIGFPSAKITATVGAISSAPATLSVGTPPLQGLAIAPASVALGATTPVPALPPIPQGASIALAATGIFADGSWKTPAAAVSWQSSNPAAVAINASTGVATGMGKGTATITAVCGLISASIAVSASAAGLAATPIVVTPATAPLAAGQTLQLMATAQYLDGSQQDVSAIAGWSVPAASSATVGTAGSDDPGVVTAGSPAGSVTVLASCFTIGATACVGTSVITVDAATLTSVAIYPANAVVTNGGPKFPYVAVATFSDGTTQSFTGPATPTGFTAAWTTSNASVAAPDASGDTTVSGAGVATITLTYVSATAGTFAASATLSVVPAATTLNALSILPSNPTVATGNTLQLTALGIYSDGSTVDLTRSVIWSPAASVSAETGLFTAGAPASVAVTATVPWQTATTATVNVTATAPAIVSIAVNMPASPLLTGQTVALTATATMSDKTTTTPAAVWSSSAPPIISVDKTTGLATAVASGGSLTLFANSPGVWGNSILVSVTPQPSDPTRFGLLVQRQNPSGQVSTLESFVNLSMSPIDASYAVTVIDNDSKVISFINPATQAVVALAGPPSPTSAAIQLSGGVDGARLVPAGDQNFELALTKPSGGYNLLDRVDIFNLLCVPGETDAPTITTLQAFCARKRAMLIVDSPQYATVAGLSGTGPVGTGSGSVTQLPNAANSAYYFPWVSAPDPLFGNRPALFPPCGFVAGICAATDASRGVWKAPAGINAGLTGNSGLQYTLTDLESGDLNPQAVNCLREFKVYGDVVWGARTLAGNDQAGSQWKYVPIRRVALYIESSLFDGTKWVVFEPNDEALWGQIRLNVGAFMQGLFLEGAFAGSTPQKAYFVKCDADNNPPASVALGVVNILVGFAPLYPAEFVVIQIQQITAQAS